MRLLEQIQDTIAPIEEAAALKLKGFPRKYKNKKKYALDAIRYRDMDHWRKNHGSMNGLTDLVDLEDAMRGAKNGEVVDIYVYELEPNEIDPDEPHRELFDTVTVTLA